VRRRPFNNDVRTFDGETLNPIEEGKHFSPFQATVWIAEAQRETFMLHQAIRHAAANTHWPSIHKLYTHFERKHWELFDKQLKKLELGITATTKPNESRLLSLPLKMGNAVCTG